MKTRLRKSMLLRYIISYAGIVLLACLLICLYFFQTSVREFDKMQRQNAQNRIDMALSDLSSQFTTLALIAQDISITTDFSPNVWKNSEYNQMVMLSLLSRYRNRSAFSQEYFLLYSGFDYVFQSSGLKTYTRVYESWVLNMPAGSLRALTDSVSALCVTAFSDDTLIVALPVRTAGYQRNIGSATLGFVLTREAIFERLSLVVGEFPAKASAYYGETLLAGEARESFEHCTLTAKDGFSVALSEEYFQQYDAARLLSGIWPAAIVLFGVALAVYIAYLTWRPIGRLKKKYAPDESDEAVDDLSAIDSMIGGLIRRDAESQNRLNVQLGRFRGQVLRMILDGNYSGEMEETLNALSLSLKGPYFSAFRIHLADGTQAGKLSAMLEDMSDDEIQIFALCQAEEREIELVVSLKENYLRGEAIELIHSLLQAEKTVYDMEVGENVTNLSLVGASLRRNIYAAEDASLRALMELIRAGRAEEAHLSMANWAEAMRGRDTAQRERYVMLDCLLMLTAAAKENGLPVDEARAASVMLKGTFAEFIDYALRQTDGWLALGRAGERRPNTEKMEEVVSYIRSHFAECDLSLDELSDRFGLSVNTLCRYLKTSTGKTYKEFLIELRIDAAKKLLSEGDKTVSEVCACVGYSNLSHFIRSFRTIVGVTPVNYRQGMGSGE